MTTVTGVVCLLIAMQATPDPQALVPRDKVSFGLTRYLPLSPPGTLASDYVPGGPQTVIVAIWHCGGRQTDFRSYTDGAAAVLFTRTRSESATRACLAKTLPQATYETQQTR
jgi:hypothetical protein